MGLKLLNHAVCRDSQDVVHKQLDGSTVLTRRFLVVFLRPTPVKLNEQQDLILHSVKEVVLANEVENIGLPQPQVVWQRARWLAAEDVQLRHDL